MGQGSWCLDDDGAQAEEDFREIDRERFERDLELRKEEKRNKRSQNKTIKEEVAKQLKRHGIEPKPYKTRGKMIEVNCACCGDAFMARVADRKRGWGKFCSKSCKATHQDKRNSKNRKYYGS